MLGAIVSAVVFGWGRRNTRLRPMLTVALSAVAVFGAVAAAEAQRGPGASTTTTTLPISPRCAQPLSGGASPLASDCLFILKVAIGIDVCEPSCVCDTNADEQITATDALTCLGVAVGAAAELACPCPLVVPCCVLGRCIAWYWESQCLEFFGDLGAVPLNEFPEFDNMGLPSCSESQIRECRALGPTTTMVTTTSTTTTSTLPEPTGACCEFGGCRIATAQSCIRGRYLGDRAGAGCTKEDLAVCAGEGPTTTTTLMPPEPLGVCCLPPRSCSLDRSSDCAAAGGIYLFDVGLRREGACLAAELEACIEVLPPTTTTTSTTSTTTTTMAPVFGACCVDGICSIADRSQCAGEYLGDSSGRSCSLAQVRDCASRSVRSPRDFAY